MGERDVEKRWDDPGAFRRATLYCVCVVIVAFAAGAVFLGVNRANVLLGAMVPLAFLLGGLGALIQGYRTYRRGGTWPVWQGAAWFLFALMLVSLFLPTLALR